jgi:aminoglycoside phosphotransferase family enzyme/predicted kinase
MQKNRLAEILNRRPSCDYAALVDFLCRPTTYPDRPTKVEVVETHISTVFLTDRYAWKLKKPVRYEFVDFSTVEARRKACEEEVRLNRRLARDVYLGVMPITQTPDGRLQLGGLGEPLDWLVQMRRLPADRFLDAMIRSRRLREIDISRVAALLADFYRQVPPLLVRPDDYRRRIEQHVRANLADLLLPEQGLSATVIKRIHSAQLQFLRLSSSVLDDRVRDGRIVDGHGDLRPEHICLESTPVVFDCIEFNPEFRQLDVVDELSFLAMECDALGAPAVGRRVLDAYCQASGDRPTAQLVSFYRSYRACVRAKVAAIRARQLTGPRREEALATAASYLRLADRYRQSSGPPLVIVVRGLSGTGKSTLAEAISNSLGLEWLSTDRFRKKLFGPSRGNLVGYGQERYEPAARDRVYREMFDRTDGMLRDGLSVVLDGTFLQSKWQTAACDVAVRDGATLLFVTCHCPAELARQRIAERLAENANASEARPDFPDLQREEQDPLPQGVPTVDVDTTESLPSQLEAVFLHLAPHGSTIAVGA